MQEFERTPKRSEMRTYTGKLLDFANPHPDMITILDIAHALSRQCRFAGHVKDFYSVAQHSIHVSSIVPAEDALSALLHDASEAYMGDMVTPLKRMIPDFERIETAIMMVIFEKFRIAPKLNYRGGVTFAYLPESVVEADRICLATEARDLLGVDPTTWGLSAPPEFFRVTPWPDPGFAERQFLDRFAELSAAADRASYARGLLRTGVQ